MRWFTTIICSSFLTLSLLGCKERESDTNLEQLVGIDLSNAREAKLSEFFQSVNYTLLDYTDEKPVVNAYKMVFTEDEIFVESRETAKVFVFDKSGQIKHIIGQNGDGPEEFRLIDELSISGDTVRIIAKHLNKYLLYTTEGEFLEEGKLTYQGESVHGKDFSLYYFQHGEGPEQWTYIREGKNITVPSKLVNGYLPLKDGFEKFNRFAGPIGFLKDPQTGEFFYNEPNDYVVQNFDANGYLKRTIRFDFGKYNWPIEKRLELAGKGRDRNDYMKGNPVVSGIYSFYPFQDVFFMTAGIYGKSNWIFLDKGFQVLDIIQEWKNDLDGMKLRQLTWIKSTDEIIYQLDSRVFFNDYLSAFNGKSVEIKPGDVHEFFKKNREKLQEEKIVLVSYKLK